MKKADISINMIMVIVITIVSIVMLLGFFSTKIPVFSKKIYCNTFFYVHKASFIPKSLRADQNYCIEDPILGTFVLEESDKEEIILDIASNIVACFEETEMGSLAYDTICYELTTGPMFDEDVLVTEEDVTQVLFDNGLCNVIENGDVFVIDGTGHRERCGEKDEIGWDVKGSISSGNNYLVEYVDGRYIVS